MQTVDRYRLNGKTYRVDPATKLGAGAEGLVLEHPDDPDRLCIKLFHPPEPGDPNGLAIAEFRARKILATCSSRPQLPAWFMLPQVPIYDTLGKQVIGFQMQRVPPKYQKLMRLLDLDFRTAQKFGLPQLCRLFADLFGDLGLIHDASMVVGDINPGCVMFDPITGDRSWVDTDSWGRKGFRCLAYTEAFMHPDLYQNLTPGAKLVTVQPHHDRFGFTVMFTMTAIPGAHPFRVGIHPTVDGLRERALAGITVFDPDVDAMIGPPEVLSDELLHELIRRLKRQTNDALDPALLRDFADQVVDCKKCDAQYHASRPQCPECQETTRILMPTLASLLIEELYKVKGTLLYAQLVGEQLYLVCRSIQGIQVLRIDQNGRATILRSDIRDIPGARYRFFADCLVVCPDPTSPAPVRLKVYRIQNGLLDPLQHVTTGVLEGEGAVFATSSRFLYRIAGNALMRTEMYGAQGMLAHTQVAEVFQRQSWFTADHSADNDREVIFGYDRALRNWQWFIIVGKTEGSNYRYYSVGDLGMQPGETVEDFAVYFSASSVLLVQQVSYNGRDYIRYAIIKMDGNVHESRIIDDSDPVFAYWSQIRGKLHQGKSVLHVTPGGIVKQDFASGACTILHDTVGHVTSEDQLIRLAGRVGIVRRSGVLAMTRKK